VKVILKSCEALWEHFRTESPDDSRSCAERAKYEGLKKILYSSVFIVDLKLKVNKTPVMNRKQSLWLDDQGVGVLPSTSSRPGLGPTQPPIQWVSEATSEVKRPGLEAYHSTPTSAEAKKILIHISAPPYAFRA
jgi:hypothetical protein